MSQSYFSNKTPAAPPGAALAIPQSDGQTPQRISFAVAKAGAGTPGVVPLEAALDPTKFLAGDGAFRTPSGAGGWAAKGAYAAGTPYVLGDWVTFNGSSYGALQASTGKQPDANPAYWQLLAQKGADGAPGGGSGDAITLQGRAIAATAPTTGQVLKYDGAQWKPDTDATGSGGGITVGPDVIPSAPQAEDDEFAASPLNAKWTEEVKTLGSGSAIWLNSQFKSWLTCKFKNANDAYRITEAVASGSGDLAITAKLSASMNAAYQACAMCLMDSGTTTSSNNQWQWGFQANSAGSLIFTYVSRRVGGTWAYNVNATANLDGKASAVGTIYFHWQRKAGNTKVFLSYDGVAWWNIGLNDSTNLTATNFTRLGIILTGGAGTTTVSIDWVRRDWIDLL